MPWCMLNLQYQKECSYRGTPLFDATRIPKEWTHFYLLHRFLKNCGKIHKMYHLLSWLLCRFLIQSFLGKRSLVEQSTQALGVPRVTGPCLCWSWLDFGFSGTFPVVHMANDRLKSTLFLRKGQRPSFLFCPPPQTRGFVDGEVVAFLSIFLLAYLRRCVKYSLVSGPYHSLALSPARVAGVTCLRRGRSCWQCAGRPYRGCPGVQVPGVPRCPRWKRALFRHQRGGAGGREQVWPGWSQASPGAGSGDCWLVPVWSGGWHTGTQLLGAGWALGLCPPAPPRASLQPCLRLDTGW